MNDPKKHHYLPVFYLKRWAVYPDEKSSAHSENGLGETSIPSGCTLLASGGRISFTPSTA